MAIDLRDADFRLARERDGLSVNLGPLQGLWTEAQYLAFTDGAIEVLPSVTDKHQVIVLLLYDLLRAFLTQLGGKVLFAPLRLQVRPDKRHEPDILLARDANDPRRHPATDWAPSPGRSPLWNAG
jgi:Uma2 family endonuclease